MAVLYTLEGQNLRPRIPRCPISSIHRSVTSVSFRSRNAHPLIFARRWHQVYCLYRLKIYQGRSHCLDTIKRGTELDNHWPHHIPYPSSTAKFLQGPSESESRHVFGSGGNPHRIRRTYDTIWPRLCHQHDIQSKICHPPRRGNPVTPVHVLVLFHRE